MESCGVRHRQPSFKAYIFLLPLTRILVLNFPRETDQVDAGPQRRRESESRKFSRFLKEAEIGQYVSLPPLLVEQGAGRIETRLQRLINDLRDQTAMIAPLGDFDGAKMPNRTYSSAAMICETKLKHDFDASPRPLAVEQAAYERSRRTYDVWHS